MGAIGSMCDDDKKAKKERHTPKPNLKQMNKQVLPQKGLQFGISGRWLEHYNCRK